MSIYLKNVVLLVAVLFLMVGCASTKKYPKEVTILLIGQSNMAGRVLTQTESFKGEKSILLLDQQGKWQSTEDVDLNVYSNLEPPNDKSKFGVSYGFIHSLLKRTDINTIKVISNSRGGTAISCWISDLCIKETLKRVDGIKVDYVLFHQGENDWLFKNKQYHQDVKTFASLVFSRIKPQYLIVGGIGRCKGIDVSYYNQSWNDLAKSDDRIGYASSDELSCFDNAHFDRQSVIKLGERYFEQLLMLMEK